MLSCRDMNTYAIWVNLEHGTDDVAWCGAVDAYLGALRAEGTITSWRIQRRKFGFGPSELGEFFIQIEVENLAQLDAAFDRAARRTGEMERLHVEVYRVVTHFRSALYRDFPDPVRGLE